MTRSTVRIMLAALLVGSVATLAPPLAGLVFAQGTGPRSEYDPKTEITVNGTLEKITHMKKGGCCGKGGLHGIVKTDQGSVIVHLAPDWYFDQKKMTLKEGGPLTVVGSQVKKGGNEYIVVKTITLGGATLALRNDQGAPLWSKPEK